MLVVNSACSTQFSVDPGRCVGVTLRNLYFDTYRLIRMLTMDL
jgi:hypothetical protein